MSKLIQSLNNEHRRMVKLLSLIEREIERFQEGNVLDYLLISSILDYLTGVGQYKLHLAEDEIFKRLQMRDPEGANALGDVRLEHEKLSFLCGTLREAITNVEQDYGLPRMWLVSVSIEYCTAMRRHLELEDKEFLPLSLKKLEKEDWDAIEKIIAEKGSTYLDPLENDALYELRDEIVNWEKDQPFT